MKTPQSLPSYESIEVPFPWWTDTALFFFAGLGLVCLFGALNSIDQFLAARVVGIASMSLISWSVLTAVSNPYLRRQSYSRVLSIHSPTTLGLAVNDEHTYSLETRQAISRYLRTRPGVPISD